MGKIRDVLAHAAWTIFNDEKSSTEEYRNPLFGGYSSVGTDRPGRARHRYTNERSIISAIYTRLAIDFAGVQMLHVKLDENGRHGETMKSGLNDCLSLNPNIDQAGRMFRQDMVSSLFDQGHVAVTPIITSEDPNVTGSYDILDMRVAKIVGYQPSKVRLEVFNDEIGRDVVAVVPKKAVAIVENPFYSVMNERNSTLQRLIRKLNLLDIVEEQAGSGSLDLIIQLPYVIKTETKAAQAEARRADIERQLTDNKYGIAYTDGSEKITQLNRPAENNLLKTVDYLLSMLYTQLGLTEEIMNGTADEAAMLNYYNRTIEPLLDAFVEEFTRKFLTKTARTQGQVVTYYRDPFKLVPLQQLGEVANQLSRNEIATANELRPFFGFKPHEDPKADQLVNSNINKHEPAPSEPMSTAPTTELEGDRQNGSNQGR